MSTRTLLSTGRSAVLEELAGTKAVFSTFTGAVDCTVHVAFAEADGLDGHADLNGCVDCAVHSAGECAGI